MAKKVMGPGPKQSKPASGSRTDSAGMQYFAKQVASSMNAKKPTPAPKKAAAPAPKKPATAPATAPAPAVAAKKPSTINKRAPLMDVSLGKKGYRMSIDTTNMNKPDEQTYNYIIKNAAGKVTSKGNIAKTEGKFGASQLVKKLKAKK